MIKPDSVLIPVFVFVISFFFSTLGRGGGTLYVPTLYWLGLNLKKEAIPLSIFLGLSTSGVAALQYGLEKQINWKVGLPFGLTMAIFAPFGARVNVGLPPEILLILFVIFTLIATIPLGFNQKEQKEREYSGLRVICSAGSGGGALGFFAGLLGRGGGAFVVPLLYLAGIDVKTAAATSAFVVFCGGVSSFISHIFIQAQPAWFIWLASVIATIIGSRLGSKFMVENLESSHLRRIFVTINVGVAFLILFKDVIFS